MFVLVDARQHMKQRLGQVLGDFAQIATHNSVSKLKATELNGNKDSSVMLNLGVLASF